MCTVRHFIRILAKEDETMDIRKKFLELTSKTYPHGTEHQLRHLLPKELEEDKHGNLFIKIGDSKCMFTSHLDTACRTQEDVKHVLKGNFIKTDGSTILGADDKAGVTIMLYMIEKNVPGIYYFFIGEERGCIGSGKSADDQSKEPLDIEKVISFDRRGLNSVITHQSGMRCCSEEFAFALAEELNKADKNFNYKKDNTGVLTDSLEFIELYSECTNISVGYYSEHTKDEQQDIKHLEKLCDACVKIKWDELPTKRTIEKYKEDDFEVEYLPIKETYETWSTDESGNTCSFVTDKSGRVVKARLTEERNEFEMQIVSEFLRSIDLEIKMFDWNGARLKVTYIEGHKTTCRRDELYPYLPELDFREW